MRARSLVPCVVVALVRGPRPVRVRRAAGALRARLPAARRRALLPDGRRRRARPELRRRPARRRRLAAGHRRRAVPDDRDAARLRRLEARLRGPEAGRLQRDVLRAARATPSCCRPPAASGARAACPTRAPPAASAAGSTSTTSATRRATSSGCWPARRPARGAPRRARGDRHLLRRRHVDASSRCWPIASAGPTASTESWQSPDGVPLSHRGRLAALAVDRPGRRAACPTAASGLRHLRLAGRRRDPGLRQRALRAGQHERASSRPLGADPGADLTAWKQRARPGRALRRRRPRDPQADPRLPRRARAADRQGDHAAAHPVGLDRRPLPGRAGPAHLRPAAPEEQDARRWRCSSATSATRARPTTRPTSPPSTPRAWPSSRRA